jgi:hypothetical protein
MSVDRHADPITLDHLILLQKKLAEAERQCENALDHMIAVVRKNQEYRESLQLIADEGSGWGQSIARAALKEGE